MRENSVLANSVCGDRLRVKVCLGVRGGSSSLVLQHTIVFGGENIIPTSFMLITLYCIHRSSDLSCIVYTAYFPPNTPCILYYRQYTHCTTDSTHTVPKLIKTSGFWARYIVFLVQCTHGQAGFRSRPVLGQLQLREFSTRSRRWLRLHGKREHNVGFFLTDYELSKIRSNTCNIVTVHIGHNLCLLQKRQKMSSSSMLLNKCKVDPEPEPGQSDGSGSSQIPRLRVAPNPCQLPIILQTVWRIRIKYLYSLSDDIR